ncbi:MAG: tRNA lysidine(34) synthetase TilS [Clostridia bacterium]|nr:tRNA lysidine(34) synthetase TilS [Clostridia bacterium]
MMNEVEEKVLKTIQKYNLIQPNDKVVLGVSGGPDSLFMLYILNKLKEQLKFNIIVAHVNHMIRAEANAEEEFVKKFCQKIDIEFYSKRIDVEKYANNNRIGTEEAGRKVRYDFFEEILEKTSSNKIAIAHNKNDKVETIIMHLLRGSGISGLQGIEPIKNNKIIRPIIQIERSEIENYCEQNQLEPRIDKSNFENKYTRNKIRNVVIPYIKEEFNPNIIETVTRLSEIITEENQYLEKQTEEAYQQILIEEKENQIRLKLKEFNNLERVIKNRIILYTITRLRGTCIGIEKIHIEDIIKLCQNNIGNKYLTPNKGLKILIKDKNIYFMKNF